MQMQKKFFGYKSLGTAVLALTMSFNLVAMDQDKGKHKRNNSLAQGLDNNSQQWTQNKLQVPQTTPLQEKNVQANTTTPIRGANITGDACKTRLDEQKEFLNNHHDSISSYYLVSATAKGKRTKYLNWKGAVWTDSVIDNVIITRANMQVSTLNNVYFSGIKTELTHVGMESSSLKNVTFNGKLKDVDFNNAVLSNVLFENVKFTSHHGHVNNFDGATLTDVYFVGCDLSKTTFKDVHLKNVRFDNSIIDSSTNFEGANYWYEENERWGKLTGSQLKKLGAVINTNNVKKNNSLAHAYTHY